MFRMAQIERLRILVNVPQGDAILIQPGQAAQVLVQGFPDRTFDGKVTRTANSLDLYSRTMLTEVQVANPQGILLPGMYAQIRFEMKRQDPPLLVPGNSLIFLANGLQVAVLVHPPSETGQPAKPGALPIARIRMRKVTVGRDYGAMTEVLSGLRAGEYIVSNPNDATREGAIVQPVLQPGTAGQPGSKPPAGTAGQPAPSHAAPPPANR
jgi:multidrug efflux pump subunit AcrA (membrane-fusion protein)